MWFNEAFSQEAEEIDEGAWIGEERIIGKVALSNFIGAATNKFFELTCVFEGNGEEFANEKEVKEFLLDFGVH